MSGTGMPPSIALQRASSACDFFSAASSTSMSYADAAIKKLGPFQLESKDSKLEGCR